MQRQKEDPKKRIMIEKKISDDPWLNNFLKRVLVSDDFSSDGRIRISECGGVVMGRSRQAILFRR